MVGRARMKNKLEERERETERRLPGLIEDGRRSVELLEIGRAHV